MLLRPRLTFQTSLELSLTLLPSINPNHHWTCLWTMSHSTDWSTNEKTLRLHGPSQPSRMESCTAVRSTALPFSAREEIHLNNSYHKLKLSKGLANWLLRKCSRHLKMNRSISREHIRSSQRMHWKTQFTRDKSLNTSDSWRIQVSFSKYFIPV